MTNPTIMTQEKPQTIDASRRKELKKAALKATLGRPEIPKPDKQQNVALLENMIVEASTPEEARELYQKLGRDLIPEKKFSELLERQFGAKTPEPVQQSPEETPTPQTSTQEQVEETTEPEIEKSQLKGKVKIRQEEYPIEDYEEAAEDAETIALRKALASEISNLDKKLALLEKIASDTGSLGPSENLRKVSKDLRENLSSRLSQLLDKKPGVGEKTIPEKDKTIAEAIESIVFDSEEPAIDPDLKKIYQAEDKRKALDQYRDETWRKLLTLRLIDSSHDPVYELGRAYENGEISGLEKSFLGEEAMSEEKPAEDLAGEIPDLYGFMEKTIQEQAQERARQQAERKRQRAVAIPADEAEQAARAKIRRMARMRREGMSEEEVGALEAAETEFQPTPEMLAVSEEINRAREIAEQQLREVQTYEQLDETTLRALENFNFTLRHLESLHATLRQIETMAKEEFETQKESAKELLGRTDTHPPKVTHWLHIESSQPKPEVTFGGRLLNALKKIIPIKAKTTITKRERSHDKKAVTAALEQFTERIAKAYAGGSISKKELEATNQLADSLAKSANPLGDLDAAFAKGALESILTEEEYLTLRKELSSR